MLLKEICIWIKNSINIITTREIIWNTIFCFRICVQWSILIHWYSNELVLSSFLYQIKQYKESIKDSKFGQSPSSRVQLISLTRDIVTEKTMPDILELISGFTTWLVNQQIIGSLYLLNNTLRIQYFNKI